VEYNCNKCGSSSTQKISAIVSGGTSHGHARSRATTVGMVDGGLAVAGTSGSTKTTMQTELAQKLAMPTRRTESWIFHGVLIGGALAWVGGAIAGFLGAMVVSAGFGVILGLVAGVWTMFYCVKHYRDGARRNVQFNRLEYPQAKEQWSLGFYCHRCENVFIPRSQNVDAVASR
jgi:hypothetical protein